MKSKIFWGGRVSQAFLLAILFLSHAPHALFAETASTTVDATVSTTTEVQVPPPPPKPTHNASEVEKKVREAFPDAPVMTEIARCESKFRQYTDSGNPLRGGLGGGMIGVFQFSEGVHAKAALKLGYDIATLEGNIGYAKYTYERSGTDPWISSFSCWNKASSDNEGLNDSSELTANLSFGQTHSQVRILQKLLNEKGFAIAEDGPGSPGNETTMFGNLTRAALRKFQCEAMSICDGDEYSTGYGYVNAKTRAVLLSYDSDKKPTKAKTAKTDTTDTENKKSDTSAKKASDFKVYTQKEISMMSTTERQALILELIKMITELQAALAAL